MSEVALQIGGRAYKVACADGEEAHIRHLARIIDGKLASLGNSAVNETQALLFAALFLADELEEARGKAPEAGAAGSQTEQVAVNTLELVADKLESVARTLEQSRASP